MVKKSIKIYARLKKEKPENAISYEVLDNEGSETITFYMNNVDKFLNNRPHSYKFGFEKVINEDATQETVFEVTAKPVVKSVLKGFNGTIFAYGQTGSGKTYAMTGSPDHYQQRGLIPRSIEEIFRHIDKSSHKYTICISYLEIYNEIGYDLLNRKQQTAALDELLSVDAANYPLPNNEFYNKNRTRKVSVHDYGNGEFHLRNLSVQIVTNVEEAMRLLLQGDANRSERICKSNITGATLHEAKHINLSLHYLEQVVVTLSQKKVQHIPFRNSMLTYLLKDSLSGNCLAVLVATLAVNSRNIEETIATCKFAQRVADVTIDPEINEEIDSNYEIQHLKREIERLRRQLLQQTLINANEKLTLEEQEKWKKFVHNYLRDTKDELPSSPFDMRQVQYCFRLLKQAVKDHEEQKIKIKSTENANKELVDQYKKEIKAKEEEINYLRSLLHTDDQNAFESSRSRSPSQADKENVPPNTNAAVLSPAEKIAFEIYVKDPENSVEIAFYKKSIEALHDVATNVASVLENCQQNILTLKSKQQLTRNPFELGKISEEIETEQVLYRNSLSKLHDLKNETKCFRRGLEKAKQNVMRNFKEWYDNIDTGDLKFDCKPSNRYAFETPHRIGSSARHRSRSRNFDRSSEVSNASSNKFDYATQTKRDYLTLKNNFWSDDRSEDYANRYINQKPATFKFNSSPDHNLHAKRNTSCDGYYNTAATNYTLNDRIPPTISGRPHSAQHRRSEVSHENYLNSRLFTIESEGNLQTQHYKNNLTAHNNDSGTSQEYENSANNNYVSNDINCTFSPGYNFLKTSSFSFERKPEVPKPRDYRHSRYSYSSNLSDFTYNAMPKIELVKNDNEETFKSALHEKQLFDDAWNIPDKPKLRKTSPNEIELTNYLFKTPPFENQPISETTKVVSALPTITQNVTKTDVDSQEFNSFIKNIPLTGDCEIDEEIVNFYRRKFLETKNN